MLKFELYKDSAMEKQYRYFREGTEDSGIVSIDLSTGKTSIVELAQGDKFKRYAFHLMRRLEEMFSTKKFSETGLVMWY